MVIAHTINVMMQTIPKPNTESANGIPAPFTFIANFPDGIHIKCTVEPYGAAEPDVYQRGHQDWQLPVDGYVGPGQATTFAFKSRQKLRSDDVAVHIYYTLSHYCCGHCQ